MPLLNSQRGVSVLASLGAFGVCKHSRGVTDEAHVDISVALP